MANKTGKLLRCAIYTRKSTEHGLELEFNSLDAQREACEAYIKSQASEGWQPLPQRYDDPAYSGGNLERPGVQKLLKDIEGGLVDVVVVYKIDRLTRSLADFAKLVDVFDAKSVSFVAVTQQFNTTTSMGRLTLNVLLSFAQFERELASERVRDKVAASRKKGKWTGGSVPLGYDTKDKRLVVNPAEAKTVRFIFSRYLALRSFRKLVDELNAKGIVTKRRTISRGLAGGISFTYGPLAYLLKNRTYLGETGHAGKWFSGEHEPIIDQKKFDRVQQILKTNSEGRTGRRERTGALLTGLVYDDRGNRMSPTYSVKNGVRYPFYVSSALLRGRNEEAGSVPRAASAELETAVLTEVRKRLSAKDGQGKTPRELLEKFVDRLTLRKGHLELALRPEAESKIEAIIWSWSPRRREALCATEVVDPRPSQGRREPQLVQTIVRAHRWLDMLLDGTFDTVEDLGAAVGIHPKVIRKRIQLAFIAPELTRSLLANSSPVPLERLIGPISLNWHRQL